MKILGIDLGGTTFRVGKVENNSLTKVVSSEIESKDSKEKILNVLFDLVSSLIEEDVQGIGAGVPSVVDVKRGIVYDVQNIPSWKEVPLKEFLEDKFHVPVYVNNDANCFAVGEKYFGKAKFYHDVVGLIIGTGLGAGIIIHDRLYSGENCGAGEFGMVPYRDHNYEYYCSGQFFINKFKATGKELSSRAESRDAKALQIFSEFGSHLGEAIKLILYALDPEIIILGGSVSKSFRFFKDKMWESIQTFVYPQTLKKIKIEVSEIENVAILGAAALYYDAIRNDTKAISL